ncbi:MAG TPA: hypothetical protein VGN63_22180 [Flavisolibacter sp.]|jgi:hypothetical protein|nr:hypothetical protein [Flavisolibacter sp.]
MKTLHHAAAAASLFFFFSCASVHKGALSDENMPVDLSSHKVLYTAINFENTVSKNTAKVHNNAAKKHVQKKTGDALLFVNETELEKAPYSDVDVYRYVLLNRITRKITKTQYNTDRQTGMPTTRTGLQYDNYVTEFYFVDRKTGKEFPHMKGTTMPLYLLKAVVNKVTGS